MYKSEKPRGGRLQETGKSYTIHWDTQHMTLKIEPKSNNDPWWWVNSSYAMHPDMKSQMGIFMSIGKGGTYTSSCKQKSI